MVQRYQVIVSFILITSILACTGTQNNASKKLPFLGNSEIVEKLEDGRTTFDTIYHTIPNFRFVNQDSQWVTPSTFQNKIYVADFFFTTCPTICPKMKSQLLRVYDEFKNNSRVAILSHTIDPRHDTVAVLKAYAERLDISTDTWHFVTGDKREIYKIAEEYMVTAQEDQQAPGGFIHSGAFLLIDKQRRIRGQYDGTDANKVDKLIKDMKILLDEN